ncbi:MAG: sporulation protein YqfD, partial [Lachnospiraceae bacterium]|nr:sporulation protein YqfD [Lachnospiraceae bacterium]
WALQFLDYRFTPNLFLQRYAHYDEKTFIQELRLTENFILPLKLEEKEKREYIIDTAFYTKKEAIAIADEELISFMKKLSEKRMKIIENNVKITMKENSCNSIGKIVVLDEIGIQSPVVMQDLKERTLANE